MIFKEVSCKKVSDQIIKVGDFEFQRQDLLSYSCVLSSSCAYTLRELLKKIDICFSDGLATHPITGRLWDVYVSGEEMGWNEENHYEITVQAADLEVIFLNAI